MTSATKILLFLRRLDCNDGVSSYCETLMRSLIDLGCEVHIVCGRINSTPQTIGRYHSMRAIATSWTAIGPTGLMPSPVALIKVSRLIRRLGIDVVNVQGFGALMWGRVLALATRRAVVATYLPSAPGTFTDVLGADERPFDTRQRFFMNAFAADRIISLSTKSTDYVVRQFPGLAGRVDTIHCGIDTDHFCVPTTAQRAAARGALGLDDATLMCLLVGRLHWNKGQDLLIRAVRLVRDTLGRPIHGYMVGDGKHEAEIRAMANEEPGDRDTLTVIGHVEDVRDVMWAADIFVLPSRLEGFGLVVVEAMACGAVPIRTPSGGASDQIVSGENGFIVPFEDAEALAEAIRTLANDTLRTRLSRCGLERVNTSFNRTVVARQVLATFDRAIARS